MKFCLTLILFLMTICLSVAQDVIIQTNGTEIQAKVIEIKPDEVKYLRFDNQSGPTYIINKSEVFMIKYENGTKDVFTTSEAPPRKFSKTSTIYFLRDSGFAGSFIGYEIFIDEESICQLDNKKYSIHQLPPGDHTFSVQFFGRESKSKVEKLRIMTEPGQTYYIEVAQDSKVYAGDTYCVQIIEERAKRLLPELTQDPDCK